MATETGSTPPKMPRWVKVLVGIGMALVVLFLILTIFDGGQHGPGRHFGGDQDDTTTDNETTPTDHPRPHGPLSQGSASLSINLALAG